jgi:hypothetical protein
MGYIYGSDKLSEYVVHNIFITIDSTRFGWVLLGHIEDKESGLGTCQNKEGKVVMSRNMSSPTSTRTMDFDAKSVSINSNSL